MNSPSPRSPYYAGHSVPFYSLGLRQDVAAAKKLKEIVTAAEAEVKEILGKMNDTGAFEMKTIDGAFEYLMCEIPTPQVLEERAGL